MKKIISLIILLSQLSVAAWGQQAFVVQRIEIQGLQRVSPATVESYLPIKRGQTLNPSQTADILRSLYKTGFFDQVTLSKQDGTLIIHVVERPTIGQLKITGNSVIPTDKLTNVMKTLDVAEGRVYNPVILERIKQSLLNQYYQLGRYNARVDVNVTPMSRNRVLVNINISEGLVAKIRRISIIGNHVFDEDTLIKQMDMTTPGLFTFFTQTDRYSETKLDENLEKLRSYYMDHGYLRFAVKSAQGEITPDRKSVYVTIVVDEGQQYTIKGYELTGNLLFPREEYEKLIQFKAGDTFNRQKVLDSEKAISKYLGEKGYMFANISLRPEINDKTHEVFVVFNINPGKRTYVRHVTFSDNNRTNDVVLRREIQQMEAAPASTTKLDESKHRLSLLPYIRDVDMSVNPVPDTGDQVDVNYKVKEDSSAQATFKVGYSQLYRTILGAGLNQKNFMGTGNTLGLNFQRSRYEQFYGIDYTDPYYTADGISRTLNASISRTDPAGAGVNVGYTTYDYNAGILFGIPVGQEASAINRVQMGLNYQNTIVNLVPKYLSEQVNTFVTEHGTHFQEMDMRLGYSRDSRDKAIFPTRGSIQTAFADVYAPLTSSSLSFYTLNYHGQWYGPLSDQFIVVGRGNLGYGNGFHGAHDYPFFKNYFAGGLGSVAGYQGYTLGPRDSSGNPLGGNMLADAGLGLVFPNHLSDNLRTMGFVNGGNVYSSLNNRDFGGKSTNSGPIRYSMGVEADWLTPFGPIQLSLAKPLNKRKGHSDITGDEQESFQFAIGANF